MITFFTILFILIGINAILMFFSLSGANQKSKSESEKVSKAGSADVYPLDLISSKYKKAV